MACPPSFVFLGNEFSPRDLQQQPCKRFAAGSPPSVVLHPHYGSHNSPGVKWQEIVIAHHVLWWYSLYRKDCTWLCMSPLGNTKLSQKAELNSSVLITTMPSLHTPSPPPHTHNSTILGILKNVFWKVDFLGGLDTGYGTFQLQVASVILAQAGNDVNVRQVFCLHEMVYSYSSSCTGDLTLEWSPTGIKYGKTPTL